MVYDFSRYERIADSSNQSGALHAALSPTASKRKRYGVDKSPLGAFKATRQITQVPQDPGSIESARGANESNGFKMGGHECHSAK